MPFVFPVPDAPMTFVPEPVYEQKPEEPQPSAGDGPDIPVFLLRRHQEGK